MQSKTGKFNVVRLKFYTFCIIKVFYMAIRSQEDLRNKVTITQSLAMENGLFESNSKLNEVRSRCGSKELLQSLCEHLAAKIAQSMPEIKRNIIEKIEGTEEELKRIGKVDDKMLLITTLVIFKL